MKRRKSRGQGERPKFRTISYPNQCNEAKTLKVRNARQKSSDRGVHGLTRVSKLENSISQYKVSIRRTPCIIYERTGTQRRVRSGNREGKNDVLNDIYALTLTSMHDARIPDAYVCREMHRNIEASIQKRTDTSIPIHR